MPWPIRFGPPPSTMIFFVAGGCALALIPVARIEIRGGGGELRSTGIDPLEHRAHAGCMAMQAFEVSAAPQQLGQAISMAKPFALSSRAARQRWMPFCGAAGQDFYFDDVRSDQEPRIDAGQRSTCSRPGAPSRKALPGPRTRCRAGRSGSPSFHARSRPDRPRPHPGHRHLFRVPRSAF